MMTPLEVLDEQGKWADEHPDVPVIHTGKRLGDSHMADFTRATELTPEVAAAIDDAFEYHKWDDQQVEQGREVRMSLAIAVKLIVKNVPPSPDRTTAIRKIREARMDCNSAITHGGKY
jgi:hypothetical protein